MTPDIGLGKGATLVPGTVELLHHKEEYQWRSEGLQALPEISSWWELIVVLEGALLVCKILAV